jgi:hypothetical protein
MDPFAPLTIVMLCPVPSQNQIFGRMAVRRFGRSKKGTWVLDSKQQRRLHLHGSTADPQKGKEQHDMKYLKTVSGLVVVVAWMVVAASPALASQSAWEMCEEVPSGKWSNSTCTTSGSGTWETKEVTNTLETTSREELELEDSKATGGAVAIRCAVSSRGTIGEEGTGGFASIAATSCSFLKTGSCEASKPATARAVNLPWATKLEEAKEEARNIMTSLVTGKNPGWAVECTVAGVLKITDTCEGPMSTQVGANRAEGTVEEEFNKASEEEPATCSIGGEKAGFVRGTLHTRVTILISGIMGFIRSVWLHLRRKP